ncbi:MAG: hypothetical protein HDT43_07910 [Ruminococcaceae bacterium]|nr:hypothetical protein [Oscillospiraceae bacterium]
MQFLYVFGLMFISIFGLAELLRLLGKALLDSSSREFDVYVKNDENIDEFIENAKKSPFIGKIYIIADGTDISARRVGTGR